MALSHFTTVCELPKYWRFAVPFDLRDFIYFPIGRAEGERHDVALVGHRIGGLVASVHPRSGKAGAHRIVPAFLLVAGLRFVAFRVHHLVQFGFTHFCGESVGITMAPISCAEFSRVAPDAAQVQRPVMDKRKAQICSGGDLVGINAGPVAAVVPSRVGRRAARPIAREPPGKISTRPPNTAPQTRSPICWRNLPRPCSARVPRARLRFFRVGAIAGADGVRQRDAKLRTHLGFLFLKIRHVGDGHAMPFRPSFLLSAPPFHAGDTFDDE